MGRIETVYRIECNNCENYWCSINDDLHESCRECFSDDLKLTGEKKQDFDHCPICEAQYATYGHYSWCKNMDSWDR